jgi:hypothetical protein
VAVAPIVIPINQYLCEDHRDTKLIVTIRIQGIPLLGNDKEIFLFKNMNVQDFMLILSIPKGLIPED